MTEFKHVPEDDGVDNGVTMDVKITGKLNKTQLSGEEMHTTARDGQVTPEQVVAALEWEREWSTDCVPEEQWNDAIRYPHRLAAAVRELAWDRRRSYVPEGIEKARSLNAWDIAGAVEGME